jgi:D-alanine transaminase
VARRDHVFPIQLRSRPWSLRRGERSGSRRGPRRERASASSPCRRTAGSGWISSRSGCFRTSLRGRKQRRAARPRPGSSTTTGIVKEGAATNAWIVTEGRRAGDAAGRFRDPARHHADDGDGYRQGAGPFGRGARIFSVEEAKQAREAFITAATTLVMPVVRIDGVRRQRPSWVRGACAARCVFRCGGENTGLIARQYFAREGKKRADYFCRLKKSLRFLRWVH